MVKRDGYNDIGDDYRNNNEDDDDNVDNGHYTWRALVSSKYDICGGVATQPFAAGNSATYRSATASNLFDDDMNEDDDPSFFGLFEKPDPENTSPRDMRGD